MSQENQQWVLVQDLPELSSDCLPGDLALGTRRSVLTCAPLAVLPFLGLDAGLQWVFLYGFPRPIVCLTSYSDVWCCLLKQLFSAGFDIAGSLLLWVLGPSNDPTRAVSPFWDV